MARIKIDETKGLFGVDLKKLAANEKKKTVKKAKPKKATKK